VQRDAKEVLAEVLGKLTGKLDAPAVSTSAKEKRRGNTVGPNRDRLTDSILVVLEHFCRISFSGRFHGSDQQISGLENFDMMGPEIHSGLSQRVHDFSTKAFPIRIRSKFDHVERSLKDSLDHLWHHIRHSFSGSNGRT
jgi:hypothetical protein